MQAIFTKHVGWTATKPDRTKAWCVSGSITLSNGSLPDGIEARHRHVAEALRAKLGWSGDLIGGDIPGGMVFVFMPSDSGYIKAPKHRITARTWWGNGGCEWFAELRDARSGNVLFELKGAGGSDSWAYDMRDALADRGMYPAHNKANPTIYFRDVCNVEYDHREVTRRKDL